ncbi:hypothetical protein L1D26_07320 [Vibrio mediterranei]|jgi:exo-beta-1,3-glucanase (GH17 family)|uniref:Endo-1,3-beta-glucanase btgC n=2 Tax=Vibrio mediterranei TaxID=689 RepID=A0ABX5DAC7_9VIBR|nr:hypothetical protein [Vibrio mediterranei]MCG9658500.1 hypothetical protein [Vibrio mediterranei]MCG9662862.1 hypothetical protein [Vibrio mediterranei]PCD88492.1 hypothetical protein COR52_11815 [Vibrio mediterranei]PRQ66642.1 hypothetical protein COR51_15600 [Vibrio mediterranei]
MWLTKMKTYLSVLCLITVFGCGDEALTSGTDVGGNNGEVNLVSQPGVNENHPKARNGDTLLGNSSYQAISYGAFRTTERNEANVPSIAELKEDLRILKALNIKILRTYNTQIFSDTDKLLTAIAELKAEDTTFEMYVMLGVWIDALNSWTTNPIDHEQNSLRNYDEMDRAIELVQTYPEIIKVVAVGNEAMVHWAEYHVSPTIILEHVERLQGLKASGDLPHDLWITSSDNWAVWAGQGDYNHPDLPALIDAVDYVSLHTYPFHDTYYDSQFWKVPPEEQSLTELGQVNAAMLRAKVHALEQVASAQAYMLSIDNLKQIHIGETGWSSYTNINYGESGSRAADEYKQKAYFELMSEWSADFGASLFFFQAFDEPWKGAADNNGDSEKHFGLINIDGEAKYVLWDAVDAGAFLGLTRDGYSIIKSQGGIEENVLDTVLPPLPQPITGEGIESEEYQVFDSAIVGSWEPIGWENTGYLRVDGEALRLTLAPNGGTAKDWGWGAGLVLTGQLGENLAGFEAGTLEFQIKGTSTSTFNIGFQTGLYGDSGRPQTNNAVTFGAGQSRQLTDDWVEHSVDMTELIAAGVDLSDVTSVLYFSGSTQPDGGIIEVRNVFYRK